MMQGGMRAVIWTDVFQCAAMFGGLTAIMIKVRSLLQIHHHHHHHHHHHLYWILTKRCAPRVELITVKIVTKRRIWHELIDRFFFTFWKISTANLRILWRHLPTELQNI